MESHEFRRVPRRCLPGREEEGEDQSRHHAIEHVEIEFFRLSPVLGPSGSSTLRGRGEINPSSTVGAEPTVLRERVPAEPARIQRHHRPERLLSQGAPASIYPGGSHLPAQNVGGSFSGRSVLLTVKSKGSYNPATSCRARGDAALRICLCRGLNRGRTCSTKLR